MQQEQQQRIMGYFIEEAKDHLNTIEQGLLNLQSTIEDSEMLNELFRAAHSVKGGAAMLGINSIHRTAHRLEDSFKLLQESPIQIDYQLETLFLQVFDILENLVEQLQTPSGLTDETAGKILSNTELIFEQLNNHLQNLSHNNGGIAVTTPQNPQETLVESTEQHSKPLPSSFKRDVLVELREMLQLFKQSDTPEHRGALQKHCQRLFQIGKEFDLPGWGELLETVRSAIAISDNSYRHLANLTIKEIKQAQELALTGRSVEITPSTELKALVPGLSKDPNHTKDYNSKNNNISTKSQKNGRLTGLDISANNLSSTNHLKNKQDTYIQKDETYIQDEITYIQPDNSVAHNRQKQGSNSLNWQHDESSPYPTSHSQLPDRIEPEMGIAEINTLADIFEGQTPDLDETWEEEEIINLDDNHFGWETGNSFSENDQSDFADLISENDQSDFADLISDGGSTGIYQTEGSTTDDLSYWLDEEVSNGTNSRKGARHLEARVGVDDEFSDLLFDADTPDTITTPSISTEDFDSLFDGNFLADDNISEQTTTNLEIDSWEIDTLADSSQLLISNGSNQEHNQEEWNLNELLENSNSFDKAENGSTAIEDQKLEFLDFEMDISDGFSSDLFDDEFAENTPDSLPIFTKNDEFVFDEEVSGDRQAPSDDLESLFGETTPEISSSPSVVQKSIEEFNWEEDLLSSGTSDRDSQLPTGDEAETELFDWGETPEITQAPSDDLESLFGEETDEIPSSPSLLESSIDDFNWDESFFATTPSASDKQVESQKEAEAEIGLFDWNEIPENQPAANEDLEALFDEATDEISNSPSLRESSTDELIWDEDFFTSEESEIEVPLQTDNKTEDQLFDRNEAIEITPVANEDLEALFSEATDDSSADSSLVESSSIDDLNWDEDLLNGQTSNPEIELTPEREAETQLFDWEENPKPTQSDRENLEALFGEATDNISEYPSLSGSSIDDLNWEEDVVYNEVYESSVSTELNTNNDGINGVFNWQETNELDELDSLLNGQENKNISTSINELDELEALLDSPNTPSISTSINELDELDALLDLDTNLASPSSNSNPPESFDRLDALLDEITPKQTNKSKEIVAKTHQAQDSLDDELEELLKQTEQSMGGGPPTKRSDPRQTRPQPRRIKVFEQNMRVSAKHLDSLSNLVGELVVSRNSLEQDQERLRQFLDNLQHQVIALSDVGSRMRDLYERSLLEGSLLASHHNYRTSFNSEDRSQNNNSNGNNNSVEYHPLEMDRFTGFHLLSQEMIELIVQVRESASDIEFLVEETDQVTRNLRQVTTQLQEGLTRSRMVPFAENADRLHRAVRDISMKLGKEAQLSVDGRETLIDKMILEHLYAPMTHLVNNALTHGIETPDIRKAAKKPAVGQIVLNAFHQGNQTVISISDDGAGIDPERIRRKAIERKLITPAEAKTLTRLDLYDFLFHPGFSTKDQADDFSGRGVGMDVVRTSLSEIRGDIYIDSTLGKGTTFTIRLPLTLSICKALCCLSERARIAFPIDGVEDMFDLPSDRIQINEEGKPCIRWRDTLLTFQPLSDLLAYNRQLSRGNVYGGKREDDLISIVVLRSPGNFLAIQVDQVLGEQEIVIKQLEGPAPKPLGIAGATVLGDGKIMPIADVLELIDLSQGRLRKDSAMIWLRDEPQIPTDQDIEIVHEPMVLIVDDSITVRELLSLSFSKAGYRVEQARDGQEAWEKLRSGLPCDIVFCDIEMPRMDGLELLSRLQKDETLSKLPIAMLTSRGAKRHRQMASQLGASGYFTKPYLEEALLDAAKRMRKGEILLSATED